MMRAANRSHRMRVLSGAVISTAAAIAFSVSLPSAAYADPLFNVKLVGRNVTQGVLDFSSTIGPVVPGDVIEYQVVGNMSPIGTMHPGGTGGAVTITSLTPGIDGGSSIRFDMFQSVLDGTQLDIPANGVLVNGWNDAMNGATTGNAVARGNGYTDVSGVRAAHGSLVFSAIAPEVIFTGTMVSGVAYDVPSSVNLRWSSGSGSIHVNGVGLPKFPLLTTETGSAPLVRFTPLTIVLPEPASAMMMTAIASVGVLRRRRGTDRDKIGMCK